MLRKIACNATNSGAIDSEGHVYVWGAGKYGLLGNPKQKNPIGKPIQLLLKSDKLVLERSSEQSLVATTISFGQYHAAVVVNDINTNSDFSPLIYAAHILKEIKIFVRRHWENSLRRRHDLPSGGFAMTEDFIIELTLKDLFLTQMSTFPYITETSLKDVLQNEAKLNFGDMVAFNRLFSDLNTGPQGSEQMRTGDNKQMINLKELRDQLVGRRCGNGILFTWGVANDGRLGIQLNEEQTALANNERHELFSIKPSVVKFPNPSIIISKVSCGNSYSIALCTEGLAYSWGLGSSGGLGQGEVSISLLPTQIKQDKQGRQFCNIKDISCGSNHCLALESQGLVYSWGNGQGGRLGHGDITGENRPKEIQHFKDIQLRVAIIEAGESTSAIISSRNELYIWGIGLNGRLGTGKSTNVLKPMMTEDLKSIKVEDIALGSTHTLCLLRNGKVLCWGCSKDGKMGLEAAMDRNFLVPKELITIDTEKIYQLAAGPFHSLALTEGGALFSFGNAKDGKLGFEENKNNVLIPRRIINCPVFQKKWSPDDDRSQRYPLFGMYDDGFALKPIDGVAQSSTNIMQTSCGVNSSLILLQDGTMFTFGSNKYGQLGLAKQTQGVGDDDKEASDKGYSSNEETKGDDLQSKMLKKKLRQLQMQQDVEVPQALTILHDAVQLKVRHISAGAYHVLAVTTEGLTFGWGRNDSGQLGIGRRDVSVPCPTKIKFLQDKKITMTAAGETHSLFLNDLGEVFSSGLNDFGELGIGMLVSNVRKEEKIGNPQESYQIEDQERQSVMQLQLLETRTELTPKTVKGLDQIGFIAAGKNHSVAIRNLKRKDKELLMYTWGCGWHGQTGHSSWQNTYEPRLLKVQAQKDAKFIMASCGVRHTLAIDTIGQLWYFGHQNSVGIHAIGDDVKQLVPAMLETPVSIKQEPFKFISSGENHNLAITSSGRVFGFGMNLPFAKLNGSDKELVYYEQVTLEDKVHYASCGAQHSLLCSVSGLPYSWGNFQNGRCGIVPHVDVHHISTPTVIKTLEQLFSTEVQRKNELKQKEMSDKLKDVKSGKAKEKKQDNIVEENKVQDTYKFPIQKILKEQQQSLDESNLASQDKNLEINFNRLLDDFHSTLSEKNEQFLDCRYNAQNAVISRILTFPTSSTSRSQDDQSLGGLELLKDIKVELPKAIIRNKQIFEAIFSMLHVHPCYMINWITKSAINRQPKEVVSLLKAVYGVKEMRNDNRIIHILMIIARKQFQFELKTNYLKEIIWGRTESTFLQIFNLIFESQDVNMKFIRNLVCSILHKLQKFMEDLKKPNHRYGFKTETDKLKYLFDYESVISDLECCENRVKVLVDFQKWCLQKFVKSIDPQFKTKTSAFLTDEIFSLLASIREDIMQYKSSDDVSDEEIDIYVLNLVFDHLIKKMREITSYQQIVDCYWSAIPGKSEKRQIPDANILATDEKRNLISSLTDNLEKYLKRLKINYTNPPIEILKEFILAEENKMQRYQEVNYRKQICELLILKPLNFNQILLRDLFLNSMEMSEATLTITVSDLIMVFNNLIEKSDMIMIQNHVDDPIMMLLDALGGNTIETKRGERFLIAESILSLKMNLQIKCRLLSKHKKYAKCCDCTMPVYEDLIPLKRFREGTQGKVWTCSNPRCKAERNESTDMTCYRCDQYRDLSTISSDQIFTKYRRVINDQTVEIFQKILIFIPLVDSRQNLDDVIEYEVKVEMGRKNPDFTKLQIFENFKRAKQQYFHTNSKNLGFDEDPDAQQKAQEQMDKEFLGQLNKLLVQSYNNIRQHERLLQDYSKLIKEIGDKLNTVYAQKQNQMCDEFMLIADNAFTGMGSEFLRDHEKHEIFSGKLHQKTAGNKGETSQKQSKADPKLEEFFKQLNAVAEPNNQLTIGMPGDETILPPEAKVMTQINRDAFKQNFGFFGKYPMYLLKERNILEDIQIEGKKLGSILKKSSYVFYDDNDQGFRVQLIYEESDTKCLVFGRTSNESIIETFSIQKHMLAEMRRTFATKSTIQFGSSQFNAFELVFMLNEIKSKIYRYGVGGGKQGTSKGGQDIKNTNSKGAIQIRDDQGTVSKSDKRI